MAKLEVDNIELGGISIADIFHGSIQTSDATASTLLELEVPDEKVITFTAIVSAKGPTNKNYWAKIEGGVRRTSAGSATLVGVPTVSSDDENIPGYDADAVVSGNFLRLQVTGASAEDVEWEGKIIYSVPPVQVSDTNNQIQYYDHTFSWSGSTTTSSPVQTEDITHNVGRPPDKIIVYIEDGQGDWYEHVDHWELTGSVDLGWDADTRGATIDHNNVQRVNLYTHLDNPNARDALVRLIWFPMDDVSTATTGLKTANLGKTQGLPYQTGVEVKTGDTFDGKPVYAKVIDFGALPNNTSKTVNHGISGGIEFLLPISSMVAIRSSDNLTFTLSRAWSSTGFDYWDMDLDTGQFVRVTVNSDRTAFDGTVFLYYTKP